MDKLVSVIIPCYNHANYLEETVNSVLASEYPFIEIVIIDDGSLDNSFKIANDLAQKHTNIRCYNQPNKGPSTARNKGIKASVGKYVLPLDADDLISENYISEAIKVLENDSKVKVVYCDSEKFGAKNGHWKLKPFSLELLARDNMIFCSAIYRKNDWEACGGYSEEMTWGFEDWEFWISMLKSGGEVVKLPFVGFYYRINANSRRKSVDKSKKRKVIDFINLKHKEFIHEQLYGQLWYQRTYSKYFNLLLKIFK